MFEDPEIRAAIAGSNIAIVWISPGAWPGKLANPEQPSLKFSPPGDADVRVAFKVDDSASTAAILEDAGATLLAPQRKTPWNSLNARLEGPAGLQLTLFSEAAE